MSASDMKKLPDAQLRQVFDTAGMTVEESGDNSAWDAYHKLLHEMRRRGLRW